MSINDCAKKTSSSTTSLGDKAQWGQGCAGDSGAAWMTKSSDGTSWNVVGVNRAAGKSKGTAKTWDRSNFVEPFKTICPGGGVDGALDDRCESTGSAISLLYPMRKKIKDALKTWGFTKAVTYTCEPPDANTGACQNGCTLCSTEMSSDCYPSSYDCKVNLDGYQGLKKFVCGDGLKTTAVPTQTCTGSGGNICRGLTDSALKSGTKQEQICMKPCGQGGDATKCDGHATGCPGLTYCCGENPNESCGTPWKTLDGKAAKPALPESNNKFCKDPSDFTSRLAPDGFSIDNNKFTSCTDALANIKATFGIKYTGDSQQCEDFNESLQGIVNFIGTKCCVGGKTFCPFAPAPPGTCADMTCRGTACDDWCTGNPSGATVMRPKTTKVAAVDAASCCVKPTTATPSTTTPSSSGGSGTENAASSLVSVTHLVAVYVFAASLLLQ